MFYLKKLQNENKETMAKFLSEHYRYNTTNSWNRLTSYANVCKVNQLGLNTQQLDKALEILGLPEVNEQLESVISMFTDEHNGCYTIGFNGRSSGYLVLYECEYRETGYKSFCRSCGQRNCQSVPEGTIATCGACKQPRVNFTKINRTLDVKSSAIDAEFDFNDFMDFSMSKLKSKVDLVMSFDKACDDIRNEFIYILNDFMVVEEIVTVPKKVKRLELV